MRAEFDFLEGIQEVEICRRVVNRVAAQHQQRLHRAGIHILYEFGERSELVHGIRLHRVRVNHGLSGIPQRLVERMCHRVDARRLMLAGDHDAGTAIRVKILHNGWYEACGRCRAAHRQLYMLCECDGERLHFRRAYPETVVRHSARERRRALSHVEPRRNGARAGSSRCWAR